MDTLAGSQSDYEGVRGESRLRDVIISVIRQNGPIPFSRYMELCLYHPELGYYSRPVERFGKAGDFYTSSDVHAVYGRLLSRQFEEMWRLLGSPQHIHLVELGPGRGLFALDVLEWCRKQFPDFSRALRYVLVEQSGALCERLRQRLRDYVGNRTAIIADSFQVAEDFAGEHVILFGNEFFDASPVELIDYRGAVRVTEADSKFAEVFVPTSRDEVEFVERYSIRPEAGERVEISFAALEWMRRLSQMLSTRSGFAIFVDYGYTREQQLAGRRRNTLMTYRHHRASPSFYDAPGEQDITANVNWTALESAAADCGLQRLALVTQSQFLLGIGETAQFADAFQDCKLPQEHAKVALQLKQLISPEGMGDVFEVLLLAHGVQKTQAARLSGLRFQR